MVTPPWKISRKKSSYTNSRSLHHFHPASFFFRGFHIGSLDEYAQKKAVEAVMLYLREDIFEGDAFFDEWRNYFADETHPFYDLLPDDIRIICCDTNEDSVTFKTQMDHDEIMQFIDFHISEMPPGDKNTFKELFGSYDAFQDVKNKCSLKEGDSYPLRFNSMDIEERKFYPQVDDLTLDDFGLKLRVTCIDPQSPDCFNLSATIDDVLQFVCPPHPEYFERWDSYPANKRASFPAGLHSYSGMDEFIGFLRSEFLEAQMYDDDCEGFDPRLLDIQVIGGVNPLLSLIAYNIGCSTEEFLHIKYPGTGFDWDTMPSTGGYVDKKDICMEYMMQLLAAINSFCDNLSRFWNFFLDQSHSAPRGWAVEMVKKDAHEFLNKVRDDVEEETSEERAREVIAEGDWRFSEDGEILHRGYII